MFKCVQRRRRFHMLNNVKYKFKYYIVADAFILRVLLRFLCGNLIV